MLEKEQYQEVIITTHDRIDFVKTLLEFGGKYGDKVRLKENTVPGMGYPFGFRAELVVTINSEEDVVKSGPHIHAIPVQYRAYTKQQLVDMAWDSFREAVATRGVKGKEREKMLNEYLKATNQA